MEQSICLQSKRIKSLFANIFQTKIKLYSKELRRNRFLSYNTNIFTHIMKTKTRFSQGSIYEI